jgi:phosphate transport system permease protein
MNIKSWYKSGTPWIWLNAGAVSVSLVLVFGVLGLTAARGLVYFWPNDVVEATYQVNEGQTIRILGEIQSEEDVIRGRLESAGVWFDSKADFITRYLLKTGNRDIAGRDFQWILKSNLTERAYPPEAMVIERREWGNAYGYLLNVKENGLVVATGEQAWDVLNERIDRALELYDRIEEVEKDEMGSINYALEKLRLRERGLELEGYDDPDALNEINQERSQLEDDFKALQDELAQLYSDINRDQYTLETMSGKTAELPVAKIVHAYRPNAMGLFDKAIHYVMKLAEFVHDDPREANTEGGIFPAIFGTVLMVIIMSIIVTPLGVVAAVYLREYAKQGFITRLIRIAVNNLAGVPSIVYGLFGLGFFVYFLGGSIDRLFFPEALPAPTFGTGGILWASLTLALLTLPVVIVATEEGLSRIPKSIREGSLALGATKAETLWRTVLPMASPAMMTGLILAVARAAGEVAPLMLVGVVKLAPSMPLDGNAPFLHLDRKFMHLGFHIYDVGFQSPNVEAARPLVYATALLLVLVIVALNLAAIGIRNHLREKYRNLEG